jgi:nucleotide-binding universal stress UspA family protein
MYRNDLNDALTSPSPGPVDPPRSIVLAVDGRSEGDSAVATASRLAELTGARIQVVSVAELIPLRTSWPPFLLEGMVAPPFFDDSEAIRSAQLARVREQLARAHDARGDWVVAMRTGAMGPEVASFAASAAADVIVVGRGRHNVVDRLFGEEHLAALLRETTVPVLAAETAFRVPAKRAIVAVDFSEHNISSTRQALSYIDEEAAVYLVHVKPEPPFGLPHPGRWIKSYDDGVRAGLERLRDQVSFPRTCNVEPIVLNGHPGVSLAEFARASRSDLIVAGAHGAGFWNRLVIGTVTTYLLRTAPCSLLLIPPADRKNA